MVAPNLPILKLQDAVGASIPVGRMRTRGASGRFRLARGPFPERPEVWTLAPVADNEQGQAAERFADLLPGRAARPRVVMMGPALHRLGSWGAQERDLAPIIRALAAHEITSWLSTRGPLDADAVHALADCRSAVRATIGLSTLDVALQRALEPDSAAPLERLDMVHRLRSLGVPVDVTLEPLLPGVSDTTARLRLLLDALAQRDVRRVTAGYLVIREGDESATEAALHRAGIADLVLGAYACAGPVRDGRASARYLPKPQRQRGYAALMALAASRGIDVRVSVLANPDFRTTRPQTAHHLRSLQETYRARLRGLPEADRTGN